MYALAHYNLGYIAFHRKNYTGAESYFNRYTQLEKGQNPAALADAYNRLGDCCLHARRFDEATRYYTRAENMGTASGDYSYYQLALVAGLQKDYNGKITLLDRLAQNIPIRPMPSTVYMKRDVRMYKTIKTPKLSQPSASYYPNIPKVL